MFEPKYHIPSGLQLTTTHSARSVVPLKDELYRLEDRETGEVEIISYREFVLRLRMPDVSSRNGALRTNSAVARIHNGGLFHRSNLSADLQDQIDFRKALCLAIDELASRGVRICAANLDKLHIRRLIRDYASKFYVRNPIGIANRGGSVKLIAAMPSGRTLLDYWQRLKESDYDEMSLPDQAWRRGNRSSHGVTTRMRELMSQAAEKFLDKKKPTVAAALEWLETLVHEENALRLANGLEPLKLVSHKTLARHIKMISATARAIARDGERAVANNRSRGTTDTRALMIGELVEIDECKLSLITAARRSGWWEALNEEEKAALTDLEEIVRARLWLLVMIDVASRMPLAWVLTEAPSQEATLELFRMATRSKHREKVIYGCECDPMPPVGIGSVKGDNGAGLRNARVKTAALGISAQTLDMRSYHSVDKPYVERLFWTLERGLLQLLHGYTGSRAGALPGYDAMANGVIDAQELYGIITRYFVDVYPTEKHYGVDMFGARPAQRAAQINDDYGVVTEVTAHDRRTNLGICVAATVTDEGVKAFGLPYNSPELQEFRDQLTGQVAVYVDPDCVNHVTVIIEGEPKPILGHLCWTAMKDLTLEEFLEVARRARAEDPGETKAFDARLARARRELHDRMHQVAREHKLPRSYMTIEEAETKARLLTAGQHASPRLPTPGTAAPGTIADNGLVEGDRVIAPRSGAEIEGTQIDRILNKPDITGKLR